MSYKNYILVRPNRTIHDYNEQRGEWMILRIEASNFSVEGALLWAAQSEEEWFQTETDPGIRKVAIFFSVRDSKVSPEDVQRLNEGCIKTSTVFWDYGDKTFHSAIREFPGERLAIENTCEF